MFTQRATVRNKHGIHCRPSAIIAKECSQYTGTIMVSADGHPDVDAKSVLLLMGLGLKHEDTVTVKVSGPDEAATCKTVVILIETCFDFERNA